MIGLKAVGTCDVVDAVDDVDLRGHFSESRSLLIVRHPRSVSGYPGSPIRLGTRNSESSTITNKSSRKPFVLKVSIWNNKLTISTYKGRGSERGLKVPICGFSELALLHCRFCSRINQQ